MDANRVSKFSLLIGLLIIVSLPAQHVPGDERGDPKLRRKTQMEGNLVRTTVFNFGQTGFMMILWAW